jgi:hypothetical protein
MARSIPCAWGIRSSDVRNASAKAFPGWRILRHAPHVAAHVMACDNNIYATPYHRSGIHSTE